MDRRSEDPWEGTARPFYIHMRKSRPLLCQLVVHMVIVYNQRFKTHRAQRDSRKDRGLTWSQRSCRRTTADALRMRRGREATSALRSAVHSRRRTSNQWVTASCMPDKHRPTIFR